MDAPAFACPSGKISHPSKAEALRVLRLRVARGRRPHGKGRIRKPAGPGPSTFEPYRCPSCGAWHLGNVTPAARPAHRRAPMPPHQPARPASPASRARHPSRGAGPSG